MATTHADIADQVRAVRSGVGLWLREDYTFVRFTGTDAGSWLQSQTTNDVLALGPGQGHHDAVLDRQGRLQAHFTLHRWGDEYWMLVERNQAPRLLQHLDDHLFIEDAHFEETGGDVEQVVIQGPQTLPFLAQTLGTDAVVTNELLPRELHGVHPVELLGFEALAFRETLTGEDGYVLVVEKGQGKRLVEALLDDSRDFAPRVIDDDAREVLRIEAGIPRFGVDMDTTTIINETPLEAECVAYDKGCYLGQEVVARLKSRGALKRALVGLLFETPNPRGMATGGGSPIFVDAKKVGMLTSMCESPTLDAPIALAYLDRDHRTIGETLAFTCGGEEDTREEVHRAQVRVLPLYEAAGREERAQALYDEGLDLFQQDPDDTDPRAIALLETAILLYPTFEDAYEVLGVILHRHGRVDDAIRVMRQLVKLNPDCLMAHTNLSVFYVAKGMIQEAEEEKAKAAVLQIQHASDERAAREAAEAERQRLEAEARERIGMFHEVLEIDPDDAVATFGLGKAYIQLNAFDEALPHLEQAVKLQPDYSAAWLDLGKCHEFLGHTGAALAAYREGIRAASKKGDLMPMREMERRMKELEAGHSAAT